MVEIYNQQAKHRVWVNQVNMKWVSVPYIDANSTIISQQSVTLHNLKKIDLGFTVINILSQEGLTKTYK